MVASVLTPVSETMFARATSAKASQSRIVCAAGRPKRCTRTPAVTPRRVRQFFSSAAVALAFAAAESAAEPNAQPPLTTPAVMIPELNRSQQLVVVTAADWNATSAKLHRFERRDGGSWRELLPPLDVTLGRAGLAWGTGVHPTIDGAAPVKREGDGRAPAGVFRLIEAFGFADPEDAGVARIPYRQLTDRTEGIDDPQSRHYNRIVEPGSVGERDWKSSERMRVEPYRWGAVVAHNWDQVPGAGSCIFLHVWEGAGVPTSGCTAMSAAEMLRLVRWLDRSKNPLLVQLPAAEYRRLRDAWKLPDLSL